MNLHDAHLSIGERLEHARYQQLREFDHRPEYRDVRVVPSESRDVAHVVAKVSTLSEPFDPDETDESADRIVVPLCSCEDCWYNLTENFEDGENPPATWSNCKHYRAAFRAENAKNDDKQATLDP